MIGSQTRKSPSDDAESVAAALADFSIVRRGPFWRLTQMWGLTGDRLVWAGVIVGLICWLPLGILLTFQQALTSQAEIPFEQSLGTHARFLLTVPLMFLAELWFDRRTAALLREFVKANIVAREDLPRFAATLRRAGALVGAWQVEAMLVILAGVLLFLGVRNDLPSVVTTWRNVGSGPMSWTWGAWWYALVSMPFFQFLWWRWTWHLLVWTWVLWRIARMKLQLLPTHPDLAGGLGGLGITQVSLTPLLFGMSGMTVASYAEKVLYGGVRLDNLALPMTAMVVSGVSMAVAPLLFFAPTLLEVKQRGRLQYGALASSYTQAFATKWIGSSPDEPLLGSADIQSLADLANSFDVIRSMRLIPCSAHDLLLLALSMSLPMLPLVFLILPLNELILRGIKMLIGI